MKQRLVLAIFGWFLFTGGLSKGELPGNRLLNRYFASETAALAENCLRDVKTLDDWKKLRPTLQLQLFEMLGLDPLPAKTPMKPTITGRIEREDFVVEKLHFQSLPGLYVTANLYLPRNVAGPLPTILYLSGHAKMYTNDISLGNKTGYQHHGIWFARNGYACLVVDTLQLGEIPGLHHGTHNLGQWWWNSRGYTPAGVEAWNNIRALDYLATRPEVDSKRIGVTGRSGGGAYSWVLAALDDRVAVSAPIAGITDLQNYVVDGKVEGHCDCMFQVNTYRWDSPLLAALTAPRPLLFGNSDKDRIFPLDGIVRTHSKVREIYDLYRASDKLGLLITEGDHMDTQDLQVPVFRWFNRFLKKEEGMISMAAVKMFDPAELRVFEKLPLDAINGNIQERFVPAAESAARDRQTLTNELRNKVFAGWPKSFDNKLVKIHSSVKEGVEFSSYYDLAESSFRIYVLAPVRGKKKAVQMQILDGLAWTNWFGGVSSVFHSPLASEIGIFGMNEKPEAWASLRDQVKSSGDIHVFFAPRGIGLTAWTANEKQQTHIRRRFMLLGQTLDSMRVWDIGCAIGAVETTIAPKRPITLQAGGSMGVNAAYAALFWPVHEVEFIASLPAGNDLPDYLNVSKVTTLAEVLRNLPLNR